MTLTTHAIAGAALAALVPEHPALGFTAGFASHFLLDAIPHWDYAMLSEAINPKIAAPFTIDRALVLDVLRIGSDMTLGLALAALFFATPHTAFAVFCGAMGGILPDALQFLYGRFPHGPLARLQRFHEWIHARRHLELEGRYALGVASQLCLLTVFLMLGVWAAHVR